MSCCPPLPGCTLSCWIDIPYLLWPRSPLPVGLLTAAPALSRVSLNWSHSQHFWLCCSVRCVSSLPDPVRGSAVSPLFLTHVLNVTRSGNVSAACPTRSCSSGASPWTGVLGYPVLTPSHSWPAVQHPPSVSIRSPLPAARTEPNTPPMKSSRRTPVPSGVEDSSCLSRYGWFPVKIQAPQGSGSLPKD